MNAQQKKYPPARASTSWRRALRSAAEKLLPPSVLVARGATKRRMLSLTFDDGPDAMTREYLDVLDQLDVTATFFVLGERCRQRHDDLLEMVRRGHEVASHGFSHRRFPTLSRGELLHELAETAAELPPPAPSPLGRALLRPPQGATSLSSLSRSAAAGYTTVLWSLDSDDCRSESATDVAARVSPAQVRPGEIVLLHEGQRWTLEALPKLVGGLREAGYELVTVGELLAP